MKQKYLYLLLFGLPGILVSAITGIMSGGMIGGFFWIFMFGDNPWPSFAWPTVFGVGILVFFLTLISILIMGYKVGKKRDLENLPIKKAHIFISLVFLVIIFSMILFRQFSSASNTSDSKKCQQLCTEKNFNSNTSSLSPKDQRERICSCFDDSSGSWVEVGTISN